MLRASLYSLMLRGITLGSRFLLVLLMARHLAPAALGVYGLMTATLSIAQNFVGLDFSVFNTRELLRHAPGERGRLIRDQLAFHGVMYLLVTPALLLVFGAGVLPWRLAPLFYLLLVVEHFSQELYNWFVTLSRPVAANLVLFLRSGAWSIAVAIALPLLRERSSLDAVWVGWSVSGLLGLLVGAWLLRKLDWAGVWRTRVDWAWIGRGVRISLLYLGSTTLYKAIEYAGRYFIRESHGEALVGIFTFYAGIAAVVDVLVHTGVITILYPQIITSHQAGRKAETRALLRKLGVRSALVSAGVSALALVAIHPVLALVDRPIYQDHLPVFWAMLATVFVRIIGIVPHYSLFVEGRDVTLFVTSLLAFGVSMVANFLLVSPFGAEGAALAALLTFAALTAFKTAAVYLRR